VNIAGKRIGNESIELHDFPIMFQIQQPKGLGWQIYDKKILGVFRWGQEHKHAIKGETIEELAVKIKVPSSNLKETVEKYNSDIDEYGYDTVFGRKTLEIGPPLRGKLVRIDTPPFYAIETYPSLTSTYGGIKINGKAQVIDVYGRVIPSLYAAGETAPSCKLGGCALGGAYIFGRIAGEGAAAEDPWE
jgi:fumarate reductase flavoprotein subunit